MYIIIQISTKKIYIGQTTDFHRRYDDYAKCKYGKINKNIAKAIRENGWKDFLMYPLEYCEINELRSKEREWIINYDVEFDEFHFNARPIGCTHKCRKEKCIYYNGYCEIGMMHMVGLNNNRKMCCGGFRSQIG